jgi:two-component system cell cycle response regulator DivK
MMPMADTVLVVEDDQANAVLFTTILSQFGGFDVVATEDGEEVLRLVGEGAVQAIVMDVSLGNTRVAGESVDGVELTRRIRSTGAGRYLPIILLTAHAMRGDRERLLFASGANDYVSKPIADQQALVELVARHIRLTAVLGGGEPTG